MAGIASGKAPPRAKQEARECSQSVAGTLGHVRRGESPACHAHSALVWLCPSAGSGVQGFSLRTRSPPRAHSTAPSASPEAQGLSLGPGSSHPSVGVPLGPGVRGSSLWRLCHTVSLERCPLPALGGRGGSSWGPGPPRPPSPPPPRCIPCPQPSSWEAIYKGG